ncbi:MAG: toll/interleukin-1 receptor domain-containing protein [Ferruginibacter sp.]
MSNETTFFSYSRSDSAFVLKLAKDLREAGADLWLDQLDIKAGSHWDSSIEAALNNSSRLIIVLTPASVDSNNVMDEVNYALEIGKELIPVLLSDCTVPFRLRRVQHIDFTGNYETGLNQLVEVLGCRDGSTQAAETKQDIKTPVGRSASEVKTVSHMQTEKANIISDKTGKKKNSKKILLAGAGIFLLVLAIWASMNLGENESSETTVNSIDYCTNDSSKCGSFTWVGEKQWVEKNDDGTFSYQEKMRDENSIFLTGNYDITLNLEEKVVLANNNLLYKITSYK